MEKEKYPKHLPNRETHYCFGCSPANPSGLQMKFYTKDSSVFSRLTVPDHLCAEGKVLEKTGKHEALLEGRLYNEEGTLCARAKANFVIFSPAVAKRLGVAREEHLQWFEEIYNF